MKCLLKLVGKSIAVQNVNYLIIDKYFVLLYTQPAQM